VKLTDKQASQISYLKRFASKHEIVEVMPVVKFSELHGKFACMIGARARGGQYTLAHLGFSKSEATCQRIAEEQAAAFLAA
jgi:hypothetical protein